MFFIKAVQCHTVLRVINNNAPKSIKPCCTSKWNFIYVIGKKRIFVIHTREMDVSVQTQICTYNVRAAVIQHS